MSEESRGEKCWISDGAWCWPAWLVGWHSQSLMSRRLGRANYQARNGIHPPRPAKAAKSSVRPGLVNLTAPPTPWWNYRVMFQLRTHWWWPSWADADSPLPLPPPSPVLPVVAGRPRGGVSYSPTLPPLTGCQLPTVYKYNQPTHRLGSRLWAFSWRFFIIGDIIE